MRQSIRVPLMSLGLVVFVAACQDGPVPAEPVVPSLAKGGKGGGPPPSPSGDIIALGGFLFQDTDLSVNQNQSCQSCHEPSQGFAAPLTGVTTRGSVVQGSQPGQFGDRKPPSAMLVNWAPPFSVSGRNASGGTFWDGRATGAVLGTPAADQAGGPFLNPKEQAMPDKACVIWRVATSAYADLWPDVWPSTDIQAITWPANTASVCTTFTDSPGEPVALNAADRAIVQEAYGQVAMSVAAFETTFDVFDSPVDNGTLTTQEEEGRKIFESNGKCQQCHDPKGSLPVYTDFEYHNLGVPKNPQSPVYHYGTGDFDPGLGGITGEAGHVGKFKTPSMRNVAKGDNRTYMHNGSLKTLEQVVQFYNTRDVLRVCVGDELQEPEKWGPGPAGDFYNCWPPPEYGKNLDSKNMGDLGLTEAEVDAVVAYLEALTGS
jgi:cytochrome c peroxidase